MTSEFFKGCRQPADSFSGVIGLYHTSPRSGKTQGLAIMISSMQYSSDFNMQRFHSGSFTINKGAGGRRRPTFRVVSSCLAFLILAGCNSRSKTSQPTPPEIVIAAAASLTDAFAEVGPRFTSKTGIRAVFSFGATADLAKQIENGAPFDVFAAADTEHVEALERKGLLTANSRLLYARGRLVMWLPPGRNLKAQRIEDIVTKEFDRIAVAKPDVAPYGRATVESLQALGIWHTVESKIVYAQNVSQTRQYASTGNAEVAFIPLALVPVGSGTYIEVPETLHRPIEQSLGIVHSSSNQNAARQFVEFLMSDEGQEIMLRKGYRKPRSN